MTFCTRSDVSAVLKGKRVALVASGPGSLANPEGLVDSHDVVVRVNNFKLFPGTGYRTDVLYSFFGSSIKHKGEDLLTTGVKLCICKCPNDKFMDSPWHTARGRLTGVDFRYIYEKRRDWWFCPTYVPTTEEFLAHFDLLKRHVPTTGFSALLDVLSYEPASVFMTGFDFFQSKVHNVNEVWKHANPSDPIGHVPGAELEWFIANALSLPITMDAALMAAVKRGVVLTPAETSMKQRSQYFKRRRYGTLPLQR